LEEANPIEEMKWSKLKEWLGIVVAVIAITGWIVTWRNNIYEKGKHAKDYEILERRITKSEQRDSLFIIEIRRTNEELKDMAGYLRGLSAYFGIRTESN